MPQSLRHAVKGGPFSFTKENGPFGTPRERLRLAVSGLRKSLASGMEMPARSVAAFRVATRLASASTIRCCSACLIEVRSNFRLPPVSTMRRAKQCRYFARSLPPRKRHSRLTTVRRGCDLSRIAEIHGEAMYTAPDSASAAALRDTDCQCAGSRGRAPCVLLGDLKGAILSRERMAPFARSPARCRESRRSAFGAAFSRPCRADT